MNLDPNSNVSFPLSLASTASGAAHPNLSASETVILQAQSRMLKKKRPEESLEDPSANHRQYRDSVEDQRTGQEK